MLVKDHYNRFNIN